jgi:hypothetical protein
MSCQDCALVLMVPDLYIMVIADPMPCGVWPKV